MKWFFWIFSASLFVCCLPLAAAPFALPPLAGAALVAGVLFADDAAVLCVFGAVVFLFESLPFSAADLGLVLVVVVVGVEVFSGDCLPWSCKGKTHRCNNFQYAKYKCL